MSSVLISENFGDLLDPRIHEIWDEEYPQFKDMIPNLYRMEPSNGRDEMRFSSVGTMSDFEEFTGRVTYSSQFQGFDTTITYLEFTNGFQVERRLYDDDQFNIINEKPRALRASAFRTRQKHAARIFNMAFANDQMFYVNSEGVPLCSNAHLTTSNASTAVGFDNKITGALTATEVATARRQFVQLLGDQGEIISLSPDTLLYGPDQYEQAFEIIESSHRPDDANNARNVHEGRFTGWEWNYLARGSGNWFMIDSVMMKRFLVWVDRVGLELGNAEEFDTYIAKWRAYMRYGFAWINWRWLVGAEVS